MWFWAISAIAGSILGSASSAWFEKTSAGRWFYNIINNVYNWAAEKFDLQVLKAEDKWRKKYPNIAAKMDKLEARINELENE